MIWAGSGVATGLDAGGTARRAASAALAGSAGGEPVSAALVVATAAWGDAVDEAAAAAAEALGTAAVAGASVHGILHGGRELCNNPAVAVLALGGVPAQAFALDGLRGDEARAGEEIADQLDGPPAGGDLVLLFADAHGLDSTALLRGLRAELAGALVMGLGAEAVARGAPRVWGAGTAVSGGVGGLVLRLPTTPRVAIAQGGALATAPMVVSRAQGNWVLALDGRPALEVYRQVAREPLASDLHRAARSLVVALPAAGARSLRLGDAVLRDVAGFDLERGGFSIPHPVEVGMPLALARLDADAARSNLTEALRGLGPAPAGFGLYLGCRTRGGALFGVDDLEAAYLDAACPSAPLLGITGPYQIAPVGEKDGVEALTHAGVLAWVDAP